MRYSARKLTALIMVVLLSVFSFPAGNMFDSAGLTASAAGETIGYTADGTLSDGVAANYYNAIRYQASGNIAVDQMKIKISVAGTGNMKCAIYSDNSGSMGSFLRGTEVKGNLGVGWQTFNLSSPLQLTSGSYYWLVSWRDGNYQIASDSATGVNYWGSLTYAASWPTNLPTSGGASNYRHSFYAVVSQTSQTIGYTADGTLSDGVAGNYYNAIRYQASGNITVDQMRIKISTAGTGNMKCAIYSDNSGSMGSFLRGTEVKNNLGVGWQTFNLSSPLQLTSGSYYWLVSWRDGNYQIASDSAAGVNYWGSLTYAANWPTNLPASGGASDYRHSLYALASGTSTGTGLKGEYFDNADFTSLKVTRTDAAVNFDWANGSPDASIGVDTYSVRWTGQVQPKYSQTYTFYTNTDDGVRLWVNNQLLIDKWINQGTTEWSGTIALTAGQTYDIRMEYYENTGGAVAKLLWSSSSQAKEIIPQSQLYPGDGGSQPPVNPKDSYAAGTNLSGICDWSTQIPFKNLIKMARWWNNSSSHGLPLDADGYPTSLNGGTAYLIYDRGSLPSLSDMTGNFVLLYDGEGNINITGSGITNVVKTPGRITYTNSEGRYFLIEITSINESNHIRNIRLVKDIYESNYESDPFVPNFISRIVNNFNTLRFMDWQNTNNSTQQNWSGRTTPSYYSWSGSINGKPVPVEVMVDLCNRTDSNAWFCMPHLATDDYMRQFATYVKNNLEPGLKVYLEFSNECWNWDFAQAQWCASQGTAIGINAYQYYAKESYEMFNVWSGVFGSEMATRVVRVLGVQAGYGNAGQATTVMDYVQADGNLTYTRADALAIAPYFSHGHSGIDNYAFYSPTTPVSTVLADCNANITDSVNGVVKMIRNHTAAIAARGNNDRGKKLDLISYEGGQHLSPYGQDAFTPLYTNANRDAAMGTLYTLYLNTWKAEGGKLFMNFSDICTPSKWGMWGILEHQDQTSTPKYDAVINFIRNNPKWW